MLPLLNAISDKQDLPKHYRGDLALDANTIANYPKGTKFLWVLRENGTVLMPLNIGVDEQTVLYWLDGIGGDMRYFHIVGENIREITDKNVRELVIQLPRDFSEEGVNRILSFRHWGIFHPPQFPAVRSSWGDWLKWFRNHEIKIMARYLEGAINLHRNAA